MKKGLILALLVVAMVALVLPVSARAPIIKSLPTIIIGDNEGASGGKGILRFPGALDLKLQSVVDWNNDESYTSDTFHAYLYPADATPATDVVAYNATRIIGTLTTPEYTALMATGAMPAADTRITSYTSPSNQNFAVNLFDAGRHPSITSPATADPATQGETQDAYSEEVAMKLVCGVTSGTTLVASAADLTVKSQSSQNDSKSGIFTEVVSYSFTGSNDGWTFQTYPGFTAATPTTAGPGSTGIGFVVSTPVSLPAPGDKCMYSIWMSPAILPSTSAEGGKVYRATATLESTSTSPDTALGYRLRYFCSGFAHQGFMIVESKAAGYLANDVVNAPYAGHPFTAKVLWAPRPDLGDMGDAEGQALVPGDWRKYKLAWEIIGWAGEQGTLTMESIYVDSFAKPAAVAKAVAWGSGTGAIPFNAPDLSGGFQTRDPVPGFTDGSIAATAANAVITLTGAEKTSRYVGIKPSFAAPLLNLQPVSNHLYRFSATLACASRTAVPTYRIVVNSQLVPLPQPAFGVIRNIGWIDWFSFCSVAGAGGKQTTYKPTGQVNCPFAPETTGSVIDVYVYSHSVAPLTASNTTIFIPILNSVDTGQYGTGTVWPDTVTAMTWSAAGWEDLGADY